MKAKRGYQCCDCDAVYVDRELAEGCCPVVVKEVFYCEKCEETYPLSVKGQKDADGCCLEDDNG